MPNKHQIVIRKTGIISLDAATTQLTKAVTLEEVKDIRDKAEAIRKYAAASGAGLDLQNAGAELKLRAERKAGRIIPKFFPHGGDRKSEEKSSYDSSNLKDLGISGNQSSQWQKIKSIPKKLFEKYIRETKEDKKELTTAGAIRIASSLKKKAERETPNLPEGVYNIFYADPPWDYGGPEQHGKFETIQDKTLKSHYPPMKMEDLCKLPISDIVAKNAVLFLWVTSPFLEKCFQVINAWGFKYKASFVWDKVKHNVGHYNSVRHEFLLISTKGSFKPDHNKLYDSVQSIKRTKHSTKPKQFREIIDDIYQKGKRIELFGRGKAPKGWIFWGNEAQTK